MTDGAARPAGSPAQAPGEVTVDSRGRRCPLPIIDLARVAHTAAPGSLIRLIADDPAAAADVAAWCRMRGQTYEGSSAAPGDAVEYRIRVVSAQPEL